mgnify:CR=1 FL=1
MTEKPLSVAVIGAGSHSRQCHGPALRLAFSRHPRLCHLSAVCDIDVGRAQAYAAEFGFHRVYGSVTEMLRSEPIDAILAITPITVTCEVVSKLLPLRIPTLIEKPAGATLAEARRLLTLAERFRTPHMVSFNRRFSPAFARLRQWLATHGKDRPPLFIEGKMVRHHRREPDFIEGTAIHAVDAIISICGRPVRASARTVSGGRGYIIDVSFSFPQQRGGRLLIAPDSGVISETYEIAGDRYLISANVSAPSVHIFDSRSRVLSWRAARTSPSCVRDGTYDETLAFLKMARGQPAAGPDLKDALAAMEVCASLARQAGKKEC